MENKCETCKVYQQEQLAMDGFICPWWRDNVVCGDKSPDDCPDYVEVE